MAKKPTPGTSPSSPDELPEGRYSDRELSWLAFNERVLDLARDTERIPLLERAKFLAIFSSNLDEFFMVRRMSKRTSWLTTWLTSMRGSVEGLF